MLITKALDMGNNESLGCGIVEENDGTFTAMTFTKSKPFKTRKGAEKWLERNGGYDNEEE
ncbi:TPA: DUF1391 domain-containing protein [Enterobacter roggenkampii]|nr:DUF1391 domain-containing protein [Enterobacter roggenkampii]